MDRFLLKRKSANEAEVEEVHVEENLAAPTTKRNNVRVFKFNEKWKDGRPWLSLEDGKMFCSYCKVFDKTVELWMDNAKKPRRLVDAYGHQRPKQAETK